MAVVAFAAGPAKPTAPARANLLLITIDTLRPDALGWVAGRNETPSLDELAREGFRLPRAVSPVPLTLPAHTSILSGLVPRRHGVRDNGQVVPRALHLLAAELRSRGYATGAFVSGYPLRAPFGLDRGFDRYDDELPVGEEGWLERPGPKTVEAALAWRRSVPAGKPWFLWVHLYDPHDPYTPPRAFWRPGPRGAYDGEVAFADDAVGALRRGLASAPQGKAPTLTVFSGDHGESLGEHGEHGHGFFVYDATILVPLVFHFPGRIRPGQSAAPVRLVDVAPTVLDLLGLPPWPGLDGRSVRALFAGRPFNPAPAYVESQQPWISYGWAPLAALRTGAWKLIAAPKPELYDLARDASETRNRIDADRPRARELERRLRAAEATPEAKSSVADDPATVAALRSLGYLGSGSSAGRPPAGLADPKDRLAQRDALSEGEVLLRGGRFREALARFDAVLAVDPKNRFATLRSGVALLKAGEAKAAVERLRKAVALDPAQAEARYALADALARSGDWQGSIPEWLETVHLQPRRAAAWSNLGLAFSRTGDLRKGVDALERAIAIEPDNAQLRENLAAARFQLARAEAAAGRKDNARRLLAQAVAANPGLRARAAADPALAPLL
ncbi:MAG TPA: sulfatase-like hydrolase/transferase [Thermoanaerobaculia bacterium]|nr:sulfatase-like hydrolase/transferase [Thermoanaerobaculia bacterium]